MKRPCTIAQFQQNKVGVASTCSVVTATGEVSPSDCGEPMCYAKVKLANGQMGWTILRHCTYVANCPATHDWLVPLTWSSLDGVCDQVNQRSFSSRHLNSYYLPVIDFKRDHCGNVL